MEDLCFKRPARYRFEVSRYRNLRAPASKTTHGSILGALSWIDSNDACEVTRDHYNMSLSTDETCNRPTGLAVTLAGVMDA